jgi:rhamnogalacturonyl hydrolase YesR
MSEIEKLKQENESLKRKISKLEQNQKCEHDWDYHDGIYCGVYMMVKTCKKCGTTEPC